MTKEEAKREWLKCSKSPAYFLHHYAYIENATDQAWVRFLLWPMQHKVLGWLRSERQLIVLKARQLGLTWLTLGYLLWLMIFRPAATILLFSLRDNEAKELLKRLTGIYSHLPLWLQCRSTASSNVHEWQLSNGSRALAFPTTGGRSFTGTAVLVDEADFIPNLSVFLNAVKPTIDAGGQMILISTVDKKKPLSAYKQIFRKAEAKQNTYFPIFLPWHTRPDRDAEWYAGVSADAQSMGNGNDDLYQEYPATIEQALAPLQMDKRFKLAWIEAAGQETPAEQQTTLALPGLRIYQQRQPGHSYIIGADSAEGNPNSDDSAACVLDKATLEQVATLGGKFEPAVFAGHLQALAKYYNNAAIMPERNNHGHATILALRTLSMEILLGHDNKLGWLSNQRGKTLIYDQAAETLLAGGVAIPDSMTRIQLASIEANTLRAPEGMHDDYADAYCLALMGTIGIGGSSLA